MESITLGQLTFAPAKCKIHQKSESSVKERRLRRHYSRLYQLATLKTSYSRSNFPDFREYAKPSRLLGVAEPKLCTGTSLEESISSFNEGKSSSLYKILLQTSSIYGSGLDNHYAGVLLCLVDETGSSILQRIPSISRSSLTDSEKIIESSLVNFQRGATDEFFFEGPQLGRIEALWVGVDSGQWRLESIDLTVISGSQPSLSTTDEETVPYSGFHYEFDADDILLGEENDLSMVELRPCHIAKLSEIDPLTASTRSSTSSIPSPTTNISNQQSMKEYTDLKLSLLSYDALLILAGTIISNLSADEQAASAFLIGGICGFSYLLLLQRSVDGLEASEMMSNSRSGVFSQLAGGIKGPVVSLALGVALTLAAAKYGFADAPPYVVSPKELIAGMLGFLVCKVAVLMAAFKPMKSDWSEGE